MHIHSTSSSIEYFSRKMQLLQECLSLSEQLLSRLEDWEALDDILTKRGAIIRDIQILDDMYPKEIIDACSSEQKNQAAQLLSLIMRLDRDAGQLLRKERERIVDAIKSNVKGQKVAGYGSPDLQRGHLVDHKK